MQLNQLNLADIRAFVLIAKLGNFTKPRKSWGFLAHMFPAS